MKGHEGQVVLPMFEAMFKAKPRLSVVTMSCFPCLIHGAFAHKAHAMIKQGSCFPAGSSY